MITDITTTDRFEILLTELALILKKRLARWYRRSKALAGTAVLSSRETDVSSYAGLL